MPQMQMSSRFVQLQLEIWTVKFRESQTMTSPSFFSIPGITTELAARQVWPVVELDVAEPQQRQQRRLLVDESTFATQSEFCSYCVAQLRPSHIKSSSFDQLVYYVPLTHWIFVWS